MPCLKPAENESGNLSYRLKATNRSLTSDVRARPAEQHHVEQTTTQSGTLLLTHQMSNTATMHPAMPVHPADRVGVARFAHERIP